ncbi:5-hydroxytryptamine receptor 3A-like [Salarias fasciatus]|uniref:5-hydroxytryptamine receptor 3A-like n=1 Tax=Salarias fasciatus TaxID=181472 RepID=UPI001176BBBE|nr:5-hydroxytryptamine receptor 3A-like [Salarias fasciatus]
MVVPVELISSAEGCTYQQVLNHLNLSKNNELYFVTRPVKNHKKTTEVRVELLLQAILDVVKTEQQFVPYVRMELKWQNDYIEWDRDDFCNIDHVTLPAEMLWKPDLTIVEASEIDNTLQSSRITIFYQGTVRLVNFQVLTTTCKMKVYKFPFDIQMCTLTLRSQTHDAEEMKLIPMIDTDEANDLSRMLMKIQYEWLFISISVTNATDELTGMDDVTYTIFMKRRAVLYIINFLLPVLLFLALDLASFLISDTGGEKLSFKVTLMLAITVMQLILHEFLPASSNKIPLIAVYYIGIFALMMLSLLEAIVVANLLEKDSSSPLEDKDCDKLLSEDCENKRSKTKQRSCERVPNGVGACLPVLVPWDQAP